MAGQPHARDPGSGCMAPKFARGGGWWRLMATVALVTWLFVLLPHRFASAVPPPTAKKVLLLYSYKAVLPANLEWDSGIREALERPGPQPIEFYTEYLDLAHHPEESYLRSLLNLLKTK